MLEIGLAVISVGIIISLYCSFIAKDSRGVQELIKRIEDEHENKNK